MISKVNSFYMSLGSFVLHTIKWFEYYYLTPIVLSATVKWFHI